MVIRVPNQRTARGGYAVLDDRMLVLDFQAGDIEAFVEIHRRYGGLARHVCQRFLPNPADADEALQETMIRVFQGLYRFNGRYALRPWIARIAKNVSLDVLRGRARRPPEGGPADDLLADPHDEADLIVERLVQRDTVLEVMAGLPETHRRALVMREIDGRSHREIARELEITPPQAKALLHRARGAFRKRWLEKVTGDGGLRAIAFLPLLWLARVGEGVRRIGERAGQAVGHATQAAQAAPEALTSAVATSAPATAGVAERVLAAGMTLLVAGGVTVGAAKIVEDRTRPEPAEVAAAAATAAQAPSVVAPQGVEEVVTPPAPPRPERNEVEVRSVPIEPEPTVEPSPSIEPTPSTDPSPTVEPTPDPSPTEEPPPSPEPPPIDPPPAWSGAASINWTSQEECGCGPGVSEVATNITGELADETSTLEFWQRITGALADAEGDAAWALEAEIAGTLGAQDASVGLTLIVGPDGHTFSGSTGSVTVNGSPGDGFPIVYTFSGTYALSSGDPETSPIPLSGTFALQLSAWADGTSLYAAQIQLAG